jgi:hypothetical protein
MGLVPQHPQITYGTLAWIQAICPIKLRLIHFSRLTSYVLAATPQQGQETILSLAKPTVKFKRFSSPEIETIVNSQGGERPSVAEKIGGGFIGFHLKYI